MQILGCVNCYLGQQTHLVPGTAIILDAYLNSLNDIIVLYSSTQNDFSAFKSIEIFVGYHYTEIYDGFKYLNNLVANDARIFVFYREVTI